MMKRIVLRTCLLFMLCVNMIYISGCGSFDISQDFIREGNFVYYEIGEKEYACVNLTEQGGQQEILYFPAYFKNGIVTKTRIYQPGFGSSEFWQPTAGVAERIYFPYTHDAENQGVFCSGGAPKEFYIKNSEDYLRSIMRRARELNNEKSHYYISTFNYPILKIWLSGEEYKDTFEIIEEENQYTFYLKQNLENTGEIHLITANTSYMFNYEGEPNEGYFFINDFERGGAIEDTPYEPRREGYTFAGWYKEPECINAWDFSKDTLPAAEYDEEGNLLFVETKLYAKWNIAV